MCQCNESSRILNLVCGAESKAQHEGGQGRRRPRSAGSSGHGSGPAALPPAARSSPRLPVPAAPAGSLKVDTAERVRNGTHSDAVCVFRPPASTASQRLTNSGAGTVKQG